MVGRQIQEERREILGETRDGDMMYARRSFMFVTLTRQLLSHDVASLSFDDEPPSCFFIHGENMADRV